MFATVRWIECAKEHQSGASTGKVFRCADRWKTDAVSKTRSGDSTQSPAARDMISSSLMVYSD